jgi:hypothetical protein
MVRERDPKLLLFDKFTRPKTNPGRRMEGFSAYLANHDARTAVTGLELWAYALRAQIGPDKPTITSQSA